MLEFLVGVIAFCQAIQTVLVINKADREARERRFGPKSS